MTSQVYSPTHVEIPETVMNENESLPQQELSYDYIPHQQASTENFASSNEIVIPPVATLPQSFSKEHTIVAPSLQQMNSQQSSMIAPVQQPTILVQANNNTLVDPILVVILDLVFPGFGHICANIPNPALKEYFPICNKYPRGWVYLICSFVFLIVNALPLITAWIPYVNIVGMLISFVLFIPNIIIQIILRVVAAYRSYTMQHKMIELNSKTVYTSPTQQPTVAVSTV